MLTFTILMNVLISLVPLVVYIGLPGALSGPSPQNLSLRKISYIFS